MSKAPLQRTTDQVAAANPDLSVWVAANAGAGKTAVLTDRVARLLLRGVRPSAILCITFTKAAAAEMANRLAATLGGWAMQSDADLRLTIRSLLASDPSAAELADARRLFAGVLDAPGRLRFVTIHAFCESLLKRFPIEAGVPPAFDVADEARSRELLEAAREALLRDAVHDQRLDAAIGVLVTETSETGFGDLLKAALGQRRHWAGIAQNGVGPAVIATLYAALGVDPDDTPEAAKAAFAASVDRAAMQRAASALEVGSKRDRERGVILRAWLNDPAADLKKLFLDSDNEPRPTFATRTAQGLYPDIEVALGSAQQHYLALTTRLKALAVARRSVALLVVGDALQRRYSEQKRGHAVLDFDDLILNSVDLLTRSEMAAWVLWKLDQGIDHVLVDEAQDTNLDQWAVIGALASEFFTGEGAREAERSLFVVGDRKQSIFSFQGAQPDAFETMHDRYKAMVDAVRPQGLKRIELGVSFRSVPEVLAAVDAVFAEGSPAADGVGTSRHVASRADEHGLVELWELTEGEAAADSEPWDAPLDQLSETSAQVRLADRVANTIRQWLARGETIGSGTRQRALTPGDIMILVRRRGPFFGAVVAALKKLGVPVAGADRMVLLDQLAIQDLLVLGDFLLLPEDDLTLATVLKGPLFGFTDDDLFELCHDRLPARLWQVLRARANERPHWQEAVERLRSWLARADFTPPFEFYATLLGAGGGRQQILSRLGADAADPLDEFLALALRHQQEHPPGLQGFLAWVRNNAGEVKRDLEQARDEVRVLTVHAAKGLEANVVFLPDTVGKLGAQQDDTIFWHDGEPSLPLWPGSKTRDAELTARLRQDRRADAEREYRRLLYVAMTRARDRLYICGPRPKRGASPEGSWYDLMASAIRAMPGVVELDEDGAKLWRLGAAPGMAAALATPSALPLALPGWTARAAPAEPLPTKPLTPSRLDIEPAPVSPLGADQGLRFKRGRIVHRLLQLLPDVALAERAAVAARLLASPLHGLTPDEQTALAVEVLAVLNEPAFAAVFAPDSRAEVPVAGRVGDIAISGQIDRLAVTGSEVLIVDFKTNRPPPLHPADVSPAYRAQLALYKAALGQVFPGKTVRCALLWTDGPRLMPVPDELLALP